MQGYKFDNENHIHTLDEKPLVGTSTMSGVLAKPLTWWASGLACAKFGWINKGNAEKGWTQKELRLHHASEMQLKIAHMEGDEYLKLLDDAYAAHSKKLTSSAKDGVDMHSVMEEYIKTCIINHEGKPIVTDSENPKLKIFIDWAVRKVKRFLWSEAHCYSRDLWIGGISDCGFEDYDGKYAILDFKSSKEVYTPQFWQCVAYAIQLEENGALTPDGQEILRLEKPIDYVAVLPFGMEVPEVQYSLDIDGGKDAVKAMLLLYKKLN